MKFNINEIGQNNKFRKLPYKLKWLGILDSPFKRPQMSFYFGRIERGVPYFLPRRWRKLNRQERFDSVLEDLDRRREVTTKVGKTFKEPSTEEFFDLIEAKRGTQKAHSTKWQIKMIGLGYKYKFDSPRHEWNPMMSITGFNRQFCIYFGLKDTIANMCYWESWIYYKNETNKDLPIIERVALCRENHPVIWGNESKGYIDYYEQILKKKYL